MKHIDVNKNNRPSTSKRSSAHLFPKLGSEKKRGVDEGILILSQIPSDYLMKREEIRKRSVSKIEMTV